MANFQQVSFVVVLFCSMIFGLVLKTHETQSAEQKVRLSCEIKELRLSGPDPVVKVSYQYSTHEKVQPQRIYLGLKEGPNQWAGAGPSASLRETSGSGTLVDHDRDGEMIPNNYRNSEEIGVFLTFNESRANQSVAVSCDSSE